MDQIQQAEADLVGFRMGPFDLVVADLVALCLDQIQQAEADLVALCLDQIHWAEADLVALHFDRNPRVVANQAFLPIMDLILFMVTIQVKHVGPYLVVVTTLVKLVDWACFKAFMESRLRVQNKRT